MQPQQLGEQVNGIATLAEPVRRGLYLWVVGQVEPVTRDQASEGVGVARHTAKFHLDRLVEEGLLDVDYKRLTGREGPGAGRPTKRYRRSARELSVALPERHYDLAGAVMASAIERSVRQGSDVGDELELAAREQGAVIGRAASQNLPSRASRAARVDAVTHALAERGYEPRVDGSVVTMANCPFHRLATEHTDLVCGMNLAMLSAVVDELRDPRLTTRLDPAPGRCCVTIDIG
jgi:predicted ArsR family transcriptional regulator